MAARMTALHLESFKSARNATIPISPLTLLVGRNGSGKSNALDGLAVLAALASGHDLRSALDGGSDGPVVRGGADGCPPLGESAFSLGCDINQDGRKYQYRVKVQTSPILKILTERLWTVRISGPKRGDDQDLLVTDEPREYSADMSVRWNSGNRGVKPAVPMRADQLALTQVSTRVPASTKAGQEIHQIAQDVIAAIEATFILDPEPHAMRSYVNEKDSYLRRDGANLSAVINRLREDSQSRETLLRLTQQLSEAQVSGLDTVSTQLGDVMATMKERIGGKERTVPASLMSDGTLRFLAMVSASLDFRSLDAATNRLLVVEELENGLHPSQAAVLIEHLLDQSRNGLTTVATTHSPAILDSLSGDMHRCVIVATRDADGWSRFQRLTEFPNYFEVVSYRSLGDAAINDRLRPTANRQPSATQALAELAGL